MSTIDIEDVKRLHLQPGDTLVLRLADTWPDDDTAAEFSKHFTDAFPGHKVVILGPGADLEVVTA
jgi:hypothetical protein